MATPQNRPSPPEISATTTPMDDRLKRVEESDDSDTRISRAMVDRALEESRELDDNERLNELQNVWSQDILPTPPAVGSLLLIPKTRFSVVFVSATFQ